MLETTVQLGGGTRLAYQVLGPGDGPVLLLLPGQANSHRWWSGLRDPFAAQYRTVTFDYRGTGDTQADPTGAAWSTRVFAEDAMAVADAVGARRALVYGTSMDLLTPADNAALIGSRIPRSTVEITQRGRHGFFDEFSSDVTPRVLDFPASKGN